MKLFKTAENLAWGMVGLAVLLILMFWVLHLTSQAPVVGGASTFVGQHASGSAYGF